MSAITIVHDGSIDVWRYEKEDSDKRRYENATPSSMARIEKYIATYGSHVSSEGPVMEDGRAWWTTHNCITNPVARHHYGELNKYRGHQRPPLGKKWEIDHDIYWEFLSVLPPKWMGGGAFVMSEFHQGSITTMYSIDGERYFCEWIDWEAFVSDMVKNGGK